MTKICYGFEEIECRDQFCSGCRFLKRLMSFANTPECIGCNNPFLKKHCLEKDKKGNYFRSEECLEAEKIAAQRLTFKAETSNINFKLQGVCSGCGNEIDTHTCYCGLSESEHTTYENHTFVPLGCTCKTSDDEFYEYIIQLNHILGK